MSGPSVELVGVSKRYGEVLAVDDIDLAIDEGEFFSILGPSGCGKTSTLRMIAGFEFPTSGSLRINGTEMANVPANRRNVNMVFQNYALFPHLSVKENVAFGLRVKGLEASVIDQRVAEALAMVQLDAMHQRKPGQLSGGQQQRVALARALVNRPSVLLLDEPLGALDQKLRKEMQFELKRLQREVGITFIYVTHDQEEALTMSDRIAVMNHGRVLQVDDSANLYDRPVTKFVASFIGTSNFLSGRVVRVDDDLTEFEVADVGLIRAKPVTPATEGAMAHLMIRPERLRLAAPADKDNSVDGVVEESIFVGNDVLYLVQLKNGTVFTVRDQNLGPEARTAVKIGDRVAVSWTPTATTIVAE
jgi:spermidine/putrescine transport system ATP-binding protein